MLHDESARAPEYRMSARQLVGPPSERLCFTPQDVFPPLAPTGLAAIPSAEGISLIWDPNNEADLGGLAGRRVAGLARAGALVHEERGLVDEQVGLVRVDLDRLARRGVARGRPDDGEMLTPLAQLVLEEVADELQRDVLERQRRAVEQLEHRKFARIGDGHERRGEQSLPGVEPAVLREKRSDR